MTNRYKAEDLVRFASRLFNETGLDPALSRSLAEGLVAADLLGCYTHGLVRVPKNVEWIINGDTTRSGEPAVLADRGAVLSWDGRYLPGPSVMMQAVDLLCSRVKGYGMATMVLQKCQHIACLAPYVLHAAEQGLMAWMTVSSPGESLVCPYGGRTPLFSTNPFAFAAPTGGTPVLMDISFAQASGGKLMLAHLEGEDMPYPCVIDSAGNPSAVPADALGGGLMPLGGMETGYKGYGLLLWSELLTAGLGGYGRADTPDGGEDNSVFIQVIDPGLCASTEAFARQADAVIGQCRRTPPVDPDRPVRIPGDRALETRKEQLKRGIALPRAVIDAVIPLANTYGIASPRCLGT